MKNRYKTPKIHLVRFPNFIKILLVKILEVKLHDLTSETNLILQKFSIVNRSFFNNLVFPFS